VPQSPTGSRGDAGAPTAAAVFAPPPHGAGYATNNGYPGAASYAPGAGYGVSQPSAYGAYAGAPGSQYIGKWNWGAFLLCPWWLMNHGRVGRGILYLVLTLIPVANISCLVMCIVYGVKGNVVASSSRRFVDDAQFVAVQNAWRNWGFGLAAVSIVIAIIAATVSH
jgi:hypothetical protein